jgi:hypothetical protein
MEQVLCHALNKNEGRGIKGLHQIRYSLLGGNSCFENNFFCKMQLFLF